MIESGICKSRGGDEAQPPKLWTHQPDFGPTKPPPPLMILWCAFFLSQIDVEALSWVQGIPLQKVTYTSAGKSSICNSPIDAAVQIKKCMAPHVASYRVIDW